MPASINPATGEVIREFAYLDPAEVDRLRNLSWDTFSEWREISFVERGDCFERIANLLEERAEALAKVMTEEMGKPIAQSEAEIKKCAWVCRYYAAKAEAFLAPTEIDAGEGKHYTRCDPLGPVLAIMPWNFPFWQVFRFAAPTLMAGNTALVKHAPNVLGCAESIAQLFADADFPEGVYTNFPIRVEEVPLVIQHQHVRAVTLTGSDRAGASVAMESGRALKKVVLELGGSDPFIVMPDADLEAALEGAIASRTLNAGQSCIAAKRMLVHESVEAKFVNGLIERFRELQVGDPMDRKTSVGPIARSDLVDALEAQVERSVRSGAQLRFGGQRIHDRGFFYQPTVLTDVRPGMPAFDEELFGPVAAVTAFTDIEDVAELANRTHYGLGASIWTANTVAAEKIAEDIESGLVFINRVVASDPRLPFGGVKRSGYGRELSREGIREFVNIKTVSVAA
ncbi:MAG: NAD-dependent succinate-semialdehyde dehydrogenase [Bdellovibrionales bacterium]|nr:NAD-dependent succinate-semialdehyde dehydrogenase [Bdellovibrionales bacterium]